METKRFKVLLACVMGWIMLSVVLYIVVPAALYGCELEAAMITENDSDRSKKIFVVIGDGMNDSLYVNGSPVPEDAYIKEEKQYILFQLDAELAEQDSIEIWYESVVPFISDSNVLKIHNKYDMPSIDFSDKYELYYGEKEDMRENFIGYIDELQKTPYRIYISIRDEGTGAINDEMMNCLKELGMETELMGKYRWSYIGAFEGGKSLYEAASESELLLYKDEYASIASGGLYQGNLAYINIGGKETAVNGRGMNIVVYDVENNRIVESVAVDTCSGLTITRLEE